MFIGPKGAGKTHIGTLMEEHFQIPFVRVEDWALSVKGDRTIDDESYLREAFYVIEKGIIQMMKTNNHLSIESTGVTHYFDLMLGRLKTKYVVVMIGVKANLLTCAQRIKERDQEGHIPVSESELARINQISSVKEFEFDHVIENENKTDEELAVELEKILST